MSQKLVLFYYENSCIEEVTLRRRSAYVTGEDFSVKKKWKWIKRKSVSLVVVVLLFCCTVLFVMRLIPLDCCYCGSSPSTYLWQQFSFLFLHHHVVQLDILLWRIKIISILSFSTIYVISFTLLHSAIFEGLQKIFYMYTRFSKTISFSIRWKF